VQRVAERAEVRVGAAARRELCQESTLLEEMGPRSVRRIDRVPLRRFDLLFGGPIARPTLCKIDVQGAELMVLAGMTGVSSSSSRPEPKPRSAKELYRGVPYGVGYFVGVWQP